MTRVTPSFVQVMVALDEFVVQYSQITDCSTMLWTPLLFWKMMSGRGVTISWPLTAEGKEWREKGGKVKGGEGNIVHHCN